MIKRKILSISLFALILTSCNPSTTDQQTEILVGAASSLTPAIKEIAKELEQDYENIKVTFTFGSSGKLAQQIRSGAPIDVFISASSTDMDTLEKEGSIIEETRTNLAKNALVFITKKDANLNPLEDPLDMDFNHFAIGHPDTVPAGRYAKEALLNLGKWESTESKFVFGKDVRQVLTFVESGNAEIGIVFASDAHSSDKVKVLSAINPELHSPIHYPGAIISSTEHLNEAEIFINYMQTPKAQQILKSFGFEN